VTPVRVNVLVATSHDDAEFVKHRIPLLRFCVVLTPDESLSGFLVEEYLWTPAASNLPASVRLRLRGKLAPLIDGQSVEKVFPVTLLS